MQVRNADVVQKLPSPDMLVLDLPKMEQDTFVQCLYPESNTSGKDGGRITFDHNLQDCEFP